MKKQNGFTLVELAIVLMIIGLLIGGILRGQELMSNARVTATIQQTKAYTGATVTFHNAYGALPGDILNPGTRLPNCTIYPCQLSGNSNGVISFDTQNGVEQSLTSKTGSFPFSGQSENTNFWQHLGVTRLISGVTTSGGNASTGAGWGLYFPAAKIGGGFMVLYANIPVTGGIPAVNGHFLALKKTPINGNVDEGVGVSVISPLRAAQIDRKMDDGLPQTGDVIGIGANCSGTSYNEASEQKDCNLLIRLQV